MDAPTPTMGSGIEELYARRGEGYPSRGNVISTLQDRQDWLAVARDIITKGGKKPSQVRRLAAMSGTEMSDVIKSYGTKASQRSLRDILIHIINSSRSERIVAPTVGEYRKLLEEMSPEPISPALASVGAAPKIVTAPAVIISHSIGRTGRVSAHTRGRVSSVLVEKGDLEPGGSYDVSHFEQLTKTQKKVLRILGGYTSGPEDSPASYSPNPSLTVANIAQQLQKTPSNVNTLLWLMRGRIRDIQEVQEPQESGTGDPESPEDAPPVSSDMVRSGKTVRSGKKEKYTPDKLPKLDGITELFPSLQSVVLAWYGYDGEGDMTDPWSYSVSRAKTSQQIATEKKVPINQVQTYLCMARKKLGWLPEDTIESEATIHQKPLIERLAAPINEVVIPARFQRRITPAPLPPKNNTPVPLTHNGETKQTSSPGQGARVIAPPREIPQQHVYVPPKPPVVATKKSNTPVTRTFWKPRREDSPQQPPSFSDLIEQAPASGRIFQKEETPPEPAPKTVLREMPEFSSYREALEWGQNQEDWMWDITLWRNSTTPTQKDNLGVLHWLRISQNPLLQEFLERARVLSGQPRGKYITILNALFEPLPEEKIGLPEIQRNPQWMQLIKNAFDQHKAQNYNGFVITIQTILSDERLGEALFAMMPEYDTTDYMDILALIADKKWTPKDALQYEHRTIKVVIGYIPGKYASLDKILREGSHVSKKTLKRELQNILLKVPIGKTGWSRFQEKDCPEVSLYDIIVALVRVEDRESPKVLFHKLEEILGIEKT